MTDCCLWREDTPKDKLLLFPPCGPESDECLIKPRRTREFDPHNPAEASVWNKRDPRTVSVDGFSGGGGGISREDPCNACRPQPLRKRPMVAPLKLRQLDDCYNCRLSSGCHNRRKVFYEKWQTYLDRMKPRPNTNYDQESNCSSEQRPSHTPCHLLQKYDAHIPLYKPAREDLLRNFLYLKNVSLANEEVKFGSFGGVATDPYCMYIPGDAQKAETPFICMRDRHTLYNEDYTTLWRQLRSRPEYANFCFGATPFCAWRKQFKRDSSFSSGIAGETKCCCNGNESPYWEIRGVKHAM